MDKEQARFILRSYRPDGTEIRDQDFTEALALAATNRELGEWLASERAMDQTFAGALASIGLPDSLRADILGCLDGEQNANPEADLQEDAMMIGALASLKAPAGLRGNILAAMDRSAAGSTPASKPAPIQGVPLWKKLSMPLAAAAGIAIALVVTRQADDNPLVDRGPVPIEVVPASFIQTYESPEFSLEVRQADQQALVANLKSRALPCPCCLPPGLDGAESIGCRELTIHGRHGSLICFRTGSHGVVHLVIFRREDVDGSCANHIDDPCYIDQGEWSVARWQNDESVFFLIGKGGVEEMAKLF